MTENTTPTGEEAAVFADEIMDAEWPRVILGEVLLAEVCVACGALVFQGSGSERTWREQHVISLHSDPGWVWAGPRLRSGAEE